MGLRVEPDALLVEGFVPPILPVSGGAGGSGSFKLGRTAPCVDVILVHQGFATALAGTDADHILDRVHHDDPIAVLARPRRFLDGLDRPFDVVRAKDNAVQLGCNLLKS